ncbi:uncharacterized protein LOC131237575 isoform X2 [Magnolia sinica]|uniref:uncharacterized protein LOC131237575 isoform X2 n=1 Tax=Magnolia sinica TaxID=86752 RepID=UPI00265A135B|nr:uncharacterized protein LOC131237575 isoform X2 [Magnolia sinica]
MSPAAMDQPPLTYRRREEPEFDMRDEFLKACITRENTNSRRFSASNLTSFREEAKSFRHPTTISSTASSPGYTPKDHFDPSTYSFTAALKALQARSGSGSGSGWEYVYGNPLHSKWNEAERYICNPLSGQVPLECLSAKTLSGRSFPTSTRITKSAPLVFAHARLVQTRTTITHEEEEDEETPTSEMEPIQRIGRNGQMTRDVGTQSTPPYLSSGNTSPESAPPLKEIPLTSCEVVGGEPLSFHLKSKAMENQSRGQMKERALMKRLQEMDAEKAKHRIPIAQGLPLTTDKPEMVHKPPVKEQTKPMDIKLRTQQRASLRAGFNDLVAFKMSWLEYQQKQLEKMKKIIEEEEIKTLRKEMVPRAQLMPLFDRPFFPQSCVKLVLELNCYIYMVGCIRSNRPLTVPKEPSFYRRNYCSRNLYTFQQPLNQNMKPIK